MNIRIRRPLLTTLAVTTVVSAGLLAPLASSASSTTGIVSDHFSSGALDTSVWTIADPIGDGTVTVSDGHLFVGVPAGVDHNPWRSADVPRVVQSVADGDLTVDAKFDSLPTVKNQMQGLLLEQDASTFARFDIHHNGTELRLFASTTVNGSAKSRHNQALPALSTIYLRVTRTGNTWTLEWSADGATWQTGTTFTQALTLNQVGPYAGNAGGTSAAAYTSAIDYVIDPANPGDPGDPDPGDPDPDDPDTTPPVISAVVATPTPTTATVQWTTNETTTGTVDYGTSSTYGSTVASQSTSTTHTVNLTDLAPDTTYHYRVSATDTASNAGDPVTGTFTTTTTSSGESIDVWYGAAQPVGSPAQTQTWANVVGNVASPQSLTSLTYRINGGTSRSLSVGPDKRRLQEAGDFNIDIPYGDLVNGSNSVVITATWSGGISESANVTLNFAGGGTLALPFTHDWSATTPLLNQVNVVDGLWTASDGAVRTVRTGYDRIIALGDMAWSDYEVTVPMTVHEFGPGAYSHLSGAPMVGLGVRWQGHTAVDSKQPAWGWFPVGAYAWYRYYETGARWELIGNDNSPIARGPQGEFIQFNTTYVMKVSAETIPSGARYSLKWWPQGTPEPTSWMGTIDGTFRRKMHRGSITPSPQQLDSPLPFAPSIPPTIVSTETITSLPWVGQL